MNIRYLFPILLLCSLTLPLKAQAQEPDYSSWSDARLAYEIAKYNFQFSGVLKQFKAKCFEAHGYAVRGKVAAADEIVDAAVEDMGNQLNVRLLADMAQVFKSFTGSWGRSRYYLVGEDVFWVYSQNFPIKAYLLKGLAGMKARLHASAGGARSPKYIQMGKDLEALNVLVNSIEEKDHVLRNRQGEELKRETPKGDEPPVVDEPAPEPPQPGEAPAP